MRRHPMSAVAVATLVAACGGHTAAPASSAAPAPAAPRATAAPAGDPSTLRFGAGNGRYKLDQTSHITQEAMGQTTTVDVVTSMIVSMVATPGEGGNLAIAFTIDSATGTTTVNGTPTPSPLDPVRGKVFRGVFAPNGKSVSFTPPDTTSVVAQTSDLFRDFLPVLGTPTLTPGTAWTDTSNASPSSAQGMTMHTQSVRQHRVVGWEAHDGTRALKIATTGNYTITGSGEAQGQSLQLSGTGIATVERFVSASGVYLGSTATDSTNMIVNVVSVGIEVPVHQSRRSSVTRLP